MIELSIHPLANRERLRAIRWYQKRSHLAAERFEGFVDQAISKIESNPYLGTRFRKHYFWIKVKRYPFLLYYRPVEAHHWVLIAIAHQQRRLGYWLKRA